MFVIYDYLAKSEKNTFICRLLDIRTNACKLKANTLKMKYENGNANIRKNQIECKYE